MERRRYFPLHRVEVEGSVVREPRVKKSKKGKVYVHFRILYATRSRANKEFPHANFLEVEIWDKLAEKYAPFLEKGRRVLLQGELVQRRWKEDGKERSRYLLVGEKLRLLEAI